MQMTMQTLVERGRKKTASENVTSGLEPPLVKYYRTYWLIGERDVLNHAAVGVSRDNSTHTMSSLNRSWFSRLCPFWPWITLGFISV